MSSSVLRTDFYQGQLTESPQILHNRLSKREAAFQKPSPLNFSILISTITIGELHSTNFATTCSKLFKIHVVQRDYNLVKIIVLEIHFFQCKAWCHVILGVLLGYYNYYRFIFSLAVTPVFIVLFCFVPNYKGYVSDHL